MSATGNSEQSGDNAAGRRKMEVEAQVLQEELITQFMQLSGALDKGLDKMESTLDNWVGGSYLKKPMAWMAFKMASRFVDAKRPLIEPDAARAAEDLAKFLKLRIMIKTSKNLDPALQKAKKSVDLEAPIRAFMGAFDFGEVRELIESSLKKGSTQEKEADEEGGIDFQEYMSKLIPLMAALPAVISSAVNRIRSRMAKQKEIPPDATIEVVSGLIRLINGREIGELINDQYLLTRMLYIGSLMMRDGNTPGIQSIAAGKLKEVLPAIDPEVYGRMKIAKAENKAALKNALSTALLDFPELSKTALSVYPSLINTEIQRLKNKIKIVEDLPEDELADTLSQGFDALETSEIGDLITSCLEVLNAVHSNSPDLIPGIVSGIVSAIDIDALEAFSEEVVPQVVEAVKPAATVVMPSLINGFCDLMTPSPGEDSDELENAVARLRNMLTNGGAE